MPNSDKEWDAFEKHLQNKLHPMTPTPTDAISDDQSNPIKAMGGYEKIFSEENITKACNAMKEAVTDAMTPLNYYTDQFASEVNIFTESGTTMSNDQCQHEYLQSGGGIPRNCIHCGEPEFTLGQKSKTIMSNQSAEEIVNDNFKGLSDLIEDNDVLQFYKDLIVYCIEGYYTSKLSQLAQENMPSDEEIDKIWNDNIFEVDEDWIRGAKWMRDKLSPKIMAIKDDLNKMILGNAELRNEIAQLQSEKEKLTEDRNQWNIEAGMLSEAIKELQAEKKILLKRIYELETKKQKEE